MVRAKEGKFEQISRDLNYSNTKKSGFFKKPWTFSKKIVDFLKIKILKIIIF